jgi:ubiquinone/menaquinone biosynthesis C-methylase UbiE
MNLYNGKFSETTSNSSSLRKKLHDKKITRLLDPRASDIILEIGCNKGELVSLIGNFSDRVYGCDINEEAINNSPVKNLEVMPVNNLKYKDNFFDKIISSHVIEHIADLEEAFKEIRRVLKPNGICVLIYPFEIFRGSNNMIQCWKIYGNLFYSRKLHVQKLSPEKISKLTYMKMADKGIFWAPFPTYYTVLRNNK